MVKEKVVELLDVLHQLRERGQKGLSVILGDKYIAPFSPHQLWNLELLKSTLLHYGLHFCQTGNRFLEQANIHQSGANLVWPVIRKFKEMDFVKSSQYSPQEVGKGIPVLILATAVVTVQVNILPPKSGCHSIKSCEHKRSKNILHNRLTNCS